MVYIIFLLIVLLLFALFLRHSPTIDIIEGESFRVLLWYTVYKDGVIIRKYITLYQ